MSFLFIVLISVPNNAHEPV